MNTAIAGARGAKRSLSVSSLALACALWAGAGHAQDLQPHAGAVEVKVGVADVLFNSGGKFTLAGQPVQGAGLQLSNDVTAVVEAEYYLHPNLSLTAIVGIPPTTNATGTGVLSPAGKLGSVRYGPGAILVKYHFGGLGAFQPYVGAGAVRMLIFGNEGAAVPDLKVNPAWGGVVQGGVQYMLDPHWGLYASVSHMFLQTDGSGTFEGYPVAAKIDLNPNVVIGGLSYRF